LRNCERRSRMSGLLAIEFLPKNVDWQASG
jgi:hypothetical protein